MWHHEQEDDFWRRLVRRYMPSGSPTHSEHELRAVRSEFGAKSPSCCMLGPRYGIKPIRRCAICKRGFCDNEDHHDLRYRKWNCGCVGDCPRHWRGRIATEAAIGAGLLHAESSKTKNPIRFRDDEGDSDDSLDDNDAHARRRFAFLHRRREESRRDESRREESEGPPDDLADEDEPPRHRSLWSGCAYFMCVPLWLHKLVAWLLLGTVIVWMVLRVQYVVIKHLPWDMVVKWVPDFIGLALNPISLPWKAVKAVFHPTFRLHKHIKLTDLPSLKLHEFSLFHKVRDTSDYQWQLWRELMPYTICLSVGHILATRVLRFLTSPSWRFLRFAELDTHNRARLLTLFQAAVGVGIVFFCHGIIDSAFVWGTLLGFFLISRLIHVRGLRRLVPLFSWSLVVAVLLLCSSPLLHHSFGRYPLRKLLPILVLRCLSFNMDGFWASKEQAPHKHHHRHTQTYDLCGTHEECEALSDTVLYERIMKEAPTVMSLHEFSLINFLSYTLYIPLYICGPIITFQAYWWQLRYPYRTTLRQFLAAFGEIAVLYVITDYVFGRCMMVSLFFGSYGGATDAYKAFKFMWPLLTPIEICWGIMCALIYLWLKFKVIWGVFRLWSITCGIHTPDNLPRFLFNHVSMQDFWRSWHLSYHLWIRRYIFVPLKTNKISRALAISLVYIFVAIWHQVSLSFGLWALIVTITAIIEFGVEKCFRMSYKHRPLPLPQRHLLTAAIFVTLTTLLVQLCMISNALGYAIGSHAFVLLFRDIMHRPFLWALHGVILWFMCIIWVTYVLRQAAKPTVTFKE